MRLWNVEMQGRILLIAHRKELITQALGHARRAGMTASIEMGSRWADHSDVIAASWQTMLAVMKCPDCHGEGCPACEGFGKRKRMTRFSPSEIGLVITDEGHHACFAAGTLIDGVPIEHVSVGMKVRSYNHSTREVEAKTVLDISCVATDRIAIVNLSSGGQIICTPDHRFFDGEQYTEIQFLSPGDLLYCTTRLQQPIAEGSNNAEDISENVCDLQYGISPKKLEFEDDTILHAGMCSRGVQEAEEGGANELPCMRGGSGVLWEERIQVTGTCKEGARVLFRGMQGQVCIRHIINHDGENEQNPRVGSNEEIQPNVRRNQQAEDDFINAGENVCFPWWKRATYKATGVISTCHAATNGGCDKNSGSSKAVPVCPELLQSGFGVRRSQISGGGRWEYSPLTKMEVFRQAENRNLECVRLESIEILERGSGRRFSEVCRGGVVYNLTIEGNHNYFANDTLVHNCAKSYRSIYKYFQQNPHLKELFVTATPKRADKKGLHNVCDSVAYEMNLRTALDEAWLVPIRQKFVTVHGLSLSDCRTRGGDFIDSDIEQAFLGLPEDEQRLLHEVAGPVVKEAKGERAIVFCAGKEHALKLTAAFNSYDGIEAGAVFGDTEPLERQAIFENFASGLINVLVNVMVCTEGYDCPSIAVVANCRPTKSESMYLQIIGRGTRTLPGTIDGIETAEDRFKAIAESAKPYCTVLDFAGTSGEVKLVSVADILAGSSVKPVDLAEAKRIAAESDEPQDMDALIEKAKRAREEKEERAKQRKLKRTQTTKTASNVDYTADDVSLYDGHGSGVKSFGDHATDKQIKCLVRLKMPRAQAERLSKRQASAVISKLINSKQVDSWKAKMGQASTLAGLREIGERIKLEPLKAPELAQLRKAYSERLNSLR
jgi:superfamily II DNA or RNA helicase